MRDGEVFTVHEFFASVSQEICPLCGQFAAGQMVELPWFAARGYVRACEECCAQGASDIRMLLDDEGHLAMVNAVLGERSGSRNRRCHVMRTVSMWMAGRIGIRTRDVTEIDYLQEGEMRQ